MNEEFFEEDNPEITNDELSQITALAEQQIQLEIEIENIEKHLSEVKERYRKLSENTLPDAMKGIGLKMFSLQDGREVKIRDEVFASIKAGFINEAIDWLEKKGFGGIAKDEIKINFDREETHLAEKFLILANKLGITAEEKLSVHAQTLKALAKEQLTKGLEFPSEYFSIFPFNKAEIKMPKIKKSRKSRRP